MPRPLSAPSTTIKRATKVSPTRIDPERSRTPSTWRRSMSWWVVGKKVFVLPRRGRRRAIAMRCGLRPATPSTLVLPALQEQHLQATSAQTCKPFVSALLPCAFSCSCSRDPVRDHAESLRKKQNREKYFSSVSTPRPHHRVSLHQSSSAALPSAATLRPGPASAPLNASGSKDLHRDPYLQA